MKQVIICLFSVVLLLGASVAAQNPKHFVKDGLSFDYPEGWTIVDESNSDAQVLALARPDSEAQIKLWVHRGKVNTPDKLAQAKTNLIDPTLNYYERQFGSMGANPKRVAATTRMGGIDAEGMRITAVLDGEPGEAGVYWTTIGERLAVLMLFGPDKAIKKAAPAWDAVRNSLKIEAPAKASPSPSPKPKP